MLDTLGRLWTRCNRLTPRRAILIVMLACAAVHLVSLLTIPLIVTPDGQRFMTQAAGYLGEPIPGPTYTWDAPGLPVLLALTRKTFGHSPMAVLAAQHALQMLVVFLITLVTGRLGNARLGLAAGLLATIEPWALTWSSYMATEPLATALTTSAAAIALIARPSWRAATAAGLLMACAAMTRPGIIIIAPFIIGAVIVRSGPRRWGVAALAGVLGLILPMVIGKSLNPYKSNAGFTTGAGMMLFWGEGMFEMLNRSDAANEAQAKLFDETIANESITVRDDRLVRFWQQSGAFESPEVSSEIVRWALRTARREPITYAVNTGHTLLWLLNAGLEDKPKMYDELPWLTRRLFIDGKTIGQNASNFQGASFAFPGAHEMVLNYQGEGPLKPYLSWWGHRKLSGWPHVPLAACAVAALVVSFRRRQWGSAAVLLGTIAFIGAHCLLLAAVTRYTSAVLPIWYMSIGMLAIRRPAAN